MAKAGRWLSWLWKLQPDVKLSVQALPVECLHTIALATRPNLQRLHLRNLFTEGRRYYIQGDENGFRLTTNSTVPWQRRRRTAIAAILTAQLVDSGNGGTHIHLQTRMRLFYALDILLIPTFITSILIFAPWPYWFIFLLIIALYWLSWVGHHLTARIQAVDLIYFVEKAIENLPLAQVPLLPNASPDVVEPDPEFREQWQKFYEEHKDKE